MFLMVSIDDGGIKPVNTSIDVGDQKFNAKKLDSWLKACVEFLVFVDKDGKPFIFRKDKIISIQPAPERTPA